ncbi:TetR/AcrR family transcriptional regulator [Dehalobacter sp. DCM]|uniref:TetR/AcrR family transcriptional regulator n=1 Tax=Dehalobacter sp. DCM TaxID=2907827 RepID=UPI003081637E|nr:TetR/AcrR family transcriptional regulator [Dehalobacter sp. DCM]
MPKYTKGYEMKHKIINAAKQLFYEKGLSSTKIIDICRLAGLKDSNFKYYYESKFDLANEISASLLIKTYRFIDSNMDRSVILDSYQKNLTSGMMYYSIILSDEKNISYYHEILKQKSVYSIMHKNVRRIYKRFAVDLNLDISIDDLKYISAADLGIRRELLLEYIDKEYDITPYELTSKIYTLTGRLFKIDENLTAEYINNALKFVHAHNFSHIKLLI